MLQWDISMQFWVLIFAKTFRRPDLRLTRVMCAAFQHQCMRMGHSGSHPHRPAAQWCRPRPRHPGLPATPGTCHKLKAQRSSQALPPPPRLLLSSSSLALMPRHCSWIQGGRKSTPHLHILRDRWLPQRWPTMLLQKRVYCCLDAVLRMLSPVFTGLVQALQVPDAKHRAGS
jgi:hypothetical protein